MWNLIIHGVCWQMTERDFHTRRLHVRHVHPVYSLLRSIVLLNASASIHVLLIDAPPYSKRRGSQKENNFQLLITSQTQYPLLLGQYKQGCYICCLHGGWHGQEEFFQVEDEFEHSMMYGQTDYIKPPTLWIFWISCYHLPRVIVYFWMSSLLNSWTSFSCCALTYHAVTPLDDNCVLLYSVLLLLHAAYFFKPKQHSLTRLVMKGPLVYSLLCSRFYVPLSARLLLSRMNTGSRM